MNEIETRVATLEEKARAQESLNISVATKLDAIAAGIARLETMAALTNAKACPAPGKCLVLEDNHSNLRLEVEAIRKEMTEIQRYVTEQKAGWKVLIALCSAASVLGGAVSWILTHFHKT